MKKPNRRFALRTYSRFPLHISMTYLGQVSAGRGIVQELSRVGCRILGNDPVIAGETLSVRIAHPTSTKPLIIEQATVQWANGLEFGVVFTHIHPLEAGRLQHLLDTLIAVGTKREDHGNLAARPIQGSTEKPQDTVGAGMYYNSTIKYLPATRSRSWGMGPRQ